MKLYKQNRLYPYLQISRNSRVESVGSMLRLFRFPKLGFDLTILCTFKEGGYFRVAIDIYK